MFNINFFADNWNRTADLWYRKWPLYQLSHNHCPFVYNLLLIDVMFMDSNTWPGMW